MKTQIKVKPKGHNVSYTFECDMPSNYTELKTERTETEIFDGWFKSATIDAQKQARDIWVEVSGDEDEFFKRCKKIKPNTNRRVQLTDAEKVLKLAEKLGVNIEDVVNS